MRKKIAVLPGDGIGPEVTQEGVKALKAAAARFGHDFRFAEAEVGYAAYDSSGTCLPADTLALCKESDAVLFGAVGIPARDPQTPPADRPEMAALLPLRQKLGLFANLRPAVLFPFMVDATSLKPELVEGGLDIMVVRELLGGLYFGEPKGREGTGATERAVDSMIYTAGEIERIIHTAARVAMKRKKRLCSVDKANVLATSQLWRDVATRVLQQYPDLEVTHMLVDNCAMQLVRSPRQFDVIVTENTFGDILSDEAAMLTGSLGMLPSASLGEGAFGLYEPVHGSAPDIAGLRLANPIATILSAGMMLRYSFGMEREADAVDAAVALTLGSGARTRDLAPDSKNGLSTDEMGSRIAEAIVDQRGL
ncbi:MAG TPA: 3-isopropylmalate dehydrogenase [Armatimonadota bacterium]|nr:3-isopropylmalate dehydrogenase [Armatimonadota bacterium]